MLRVPTVSGDEVVCGAGTRRPPQTYLSEGLADRQGYSQGLGVGRFSVLSTLALLLFSGIPPAYKPWEVPL